MRDAKRGGGIARWPGLALCAAGLVAAVAACSTSRIDLDQLPTEPIALTWWESDDARDLLDAMDPQGAAAPLSEQARKAVLAANPGRLMLLDPRTRELRPVGAAPPGARALAFSPDHQRLLFESDRIAGSPQIYEVDLASGNLTTLTHGLVHRGADYTPEGLVILRVDSEQALTAEVVRTTRSGGRATGIYETAVGDTIRASPDGSRLLWEQLRSTAAVTNRGAQWFLVIAAAEAGEPPQPLAPGRDPVFHPDGGWIVYTAPSAGSMQLRRIRPDGTGRAPLGAASLPAEAPAISPDGRYVAYVGRDSRGAKLYIRRFDGTGDRVLLDDGMAMAPVW